ERHKSKNRYFTEDLGDGVLLHLAEIPTGRFLMGAPAGEAESGDNERPQHWVSMSPFFMGVYPVTQEQWRAVVRLPKVKCDLPGVHSRFKISWSIGDKRPVDEVSWLEAVEFCERLSRQTGKLYRLPSEAEWEYACRAGTTTPFHFGEAITPELANYDGQYPYGQAAKGQNRGETTEVGSFRVANDFGLYDMHGNVWEWCEDIYHDDYARAPMN